MQNLGKKSLVLLSTGALLAAIAVAVPSSSSAANLSSGSTAYVVNGQEETFTFDPIQRKNGTLVPLELFQRFGVEIAGATGNLIKLTEGSTQINLTLGRTATVVNGLPGSVTVEPVRLSGRLFLPAELLREFGVEFSQESGYVFLREFVSGQPTVKVTDQAEFDRLKNSRTFNPSVKLDSGQYAQAQFTLLNKDLLQMDKLPVSLGARARLQGLIETNTLVLANLQNYAAKSGAFQTTGLYMIDNNRNQYDVQEVIDLGEGLLSSKLAPGADRMGVLVFPLIKPNPGNIKLYLDANAGDLGSWFNL
ncbi:MAG TPA: stalk domain-containing protein [Symbiobacteriaceae bacterium]|nr:stalk domain-containing protein [Symbiobacteriaceae bacterium]